MQAAEVRSPSSSPMIVPVIIGIVAVLLVGLGGAALLLLTKKKENAVPNTVSLSSKTETVLVPPTPPSAPVAEKPPVAPVAKVEPKVTIPEPARTAPAPVVEAKAVAPAVQPATAKLSAETQPASIPAAEAKPVIVTNVEPAVAAAPAPPPVPTFPVIKLQGIFYRKSNPTVMLNGNTVEVGKKVDGVTVAKIEPAAVTLEWNGETKVLELH